MSTCRSCSNFAHQDDDLGASDVEKYMPWPLQPAWRQGWRGNLIVQRLCPMLPRSLSWSFLLASKYALNFPDNPNWYCVVEAVIVPFVTSYWCVDDLRLRYGAGAGWWLLWHSAARYHSVGSVLPGLWVVHGAGVQEERVRH